MNELLFASGFVAKTCLVCVFAFLIGFLLRGHSSRIRHVIFVSAFGLLLLLPITELIFLNWSIDVPVVASQRVTSEIQASQSAPSPPAVDSATVGSQELNPQELYSDRGLRREKGSDLDSLLHSESESTAPNTAVTDIAHSQEVSSVLGWFRWYSACLMIWLTGTLIYWLRLVLAAHRLNKLSTSPLPESGQLSGMLEESRTALGCRTSVGLRLISDNSIPMVAGIVRPIIYLPSCAIEWEQQCTKSALLHELSHVVRRDCHTDIFAQVITGLYWWNPLVWVLKNKLEIEREKACDELVVSKASDATDYAENLVWIVRHSSEKRFASTIAMSRNSVLTTRVRNILRFTSSSMRDTLFQSLTGRSLLALFVAASIPLAMTKLTTYVESDVMVESVQEEQAKTPLKLDRETALAHWSEKYDISKALLASVERNQKAKFKLISTQGVVTNESGQPIPNTIVQIRLRKPLIPVADPKPVLVVAETKTDAGGNFKFVDVPSPPLIPYNPPLILLASAEGHGFQWANLDLAGDSSGLNFILKPEAPISGTVVSQNGKPIVGASLILRSVTPKGAYEYENTKDVSVSFSPKDKVFRPTTNEKGDFQIRGVPADTRVVFSTKHPEYATDNLAFATNSKTPVKPIKSHTFDAKTKERKETSIDVPHQHFNVTLNRGNKICGQLVFADSGEPAANLNGNLYLDQQRFSFKQFKTDENGRFDFERFGATKAVVHIRPPKESPYVYTFETVEFTKDESSDRTLALTMVLGEKISGTVKSAKGKPAKNITVEFYGPKYAFPTYISRRHDCKTNDQGEFELFVAPGAGDLIPSGYSPGLELPSRRMISMRDIRPYEKFITRKAITVKAGEKHPPVSLIVPSSIEFASQVVDEDGNPMVGAKIDLVKAEGVLGDDGYSNRQEVFSNLNTDEQGRFKIESLPHDSNAAFLVTHAESDLASLLKINSDSDVPSEIKLQKASKVHGLVLKDDKPIAGVPVIISLQLSSVPTGRHGGHRVSYFNFATKETDENGKYEFLIPANHQVSLNARLPDGDARNHIHQVVPSPGQTVEMPVFKFLTLSESVSGIVVDPQGNPITNVRVSVYPEQRYNPAEVRQIYDRAYKERGHKPFITESDGKFAIPYLPANQPVRVFARITDAKGKTAASATVIARTGDKNIKVVIDPKLATQPRRR